MKKRLVLYYSRTGTTEHLAKLLASALDADLAQIECDQYRGAFGYVRAAYDSLKRRLPDIKVSIDSVEKYDLLILGGPIWTSYPAAPLRAFLAQKRALPKQVALFMTYGGHSPAAKAEREIEDMLGSGLTGTILAKASELGSGLDSGRTPKNLTAFIDTLNKI